MEKIYKEGVLADLNFPDWIEKAKLLESVEIYLEFQNSSIFIKRFQAFTTISF